MYNPIQKIIEVYYSYRDNYREMTKILKKRDEDFYKIVQKDIDEMPKSSSEIVPQSIGERFFKSFEASQKKKLESLV